MPIDITQRSLAAACSATTDAIHLIRIDSGSMFRTYWDRESAPRYKVGDGFAPLAPTIATTGSDGLYYAGVLEDSEHVNIYYLDDALAVFQSGKENRSIAEFQGSTKHPPLMFSRDLETVELFYINADGGGMEWAQSSGETNELAFPERESLGGTFTSNPAAVSWSQDRIDAFGLGSNSAMYHLLWDSADGWTQPWESLGGIFTSDPAVASWSSDRLDVFGMGSDYALYHRAWDASSWQPGVDDKWENLGGSWTSPPTVVSWGEGRLDVFALGDDYKVWHHSYDSKEGRWQESPDDIGGGGSVMSTPPVAVSCESDRLDVFGVGADDNAVYHKGWDGSSWGEWESLVPLTGSDSDGDAQTSSGTPPGSTSQNDQSEETTSDDSISSESTETSSSASAESTSTTESTESTDLQDDDQSPSTTQESTDGTESISISTNEPSTVTSTLLSTQTAAGGAPSTYTAQATIASTGSPETSDLSSTLRSESTQSSTPSGQPAQSHGRPNFQLVWFLLTTVQFSLFLNLL